MVHQLYHCHSIAKVIWRGSFFNTNVNLPWCPQSSWVRI